MLAASSMDPRSKIPVLALIGLSLTACGKDDTIVGTWTAVLVDMDKFPMVEMMEGYSSRFGAELRVEDDLSGDFGYYAAYSMDGVGMRQEQRFGVTVDDDDAPRYHISIDYVPDVQSEPPGVPYEGPVPADAMGPLGSLRARSIPLAAETSPYFDCELAGDRLDCTLTGTGEPGSPPVPWQFVRKSEEG